jgi:hypothetical protein
MTGEIDRARQPYSHIEHRYAEPFAEALADDAGFRDWVLGKTKFADRGVCRVLCSEMRAIRTNPQAPWWKNHFTNSCNCFGCGGRETDIFAVLEDERGFRFGLHVEVKQPKDRFNPLSRQAERYKARAECWSKSAPPTILAHSDAATVILCSEEKLKAFAAEIELFDVPITFEEIRREFPNATLVSAF